MVGPQSAAVPDRELDTNTGAHTGQKRERRPTLLKGWAAALVVFAIYVAIVPIGRSFSFVEINYNEGWNLYNAQAVAEGHLLYPVRYGWTSVNYPMLSFWLIARLHALTRDYLFTARAVSVLSLACVALFSGMIVRALGGNRRASLLAGIFCWCVFCTDAASYVGMDDPQLLALALSVAGLLLYVRQRRKTLPLVGAAVLFTLGLCVKQNLIDLPAAVLLDLAITSTSLALWFSFCLAVCGALAILLNIHFGGPFFVSQLLARRNYSGAKVLQQLVFVLGPVLLPFALAALTAVRLRRDGTRRLASILFFCTLATGAFFSGGEGVAINALFTSLIAVCILVGLFFDNVEKDFVDGGVSRAVAWAVPVSFLWLGIPLLVCGNWNPWARLREVHRAEGLFERDVAYLQQHSGPALCESLLTCSAAGKPYAYDPFNATRLVAFHKLSAESMVQALRERHFGVIQTEGLLSREDPVREERFAPAIQAAIEANYAPALEHSVPDLLDPGAKGMVVMYLPKAAVSASASRMESPSNAAPATPKD